jgi:hypothetical protein
MGVDHVTFSVSEFYVTPDLFRGPPGRTFSSN